MPGGKYLYVMDNTNTTLVLQAGPRFKQLARNVLQNTQGIAHYGGARQEQTLSTPAFAGKRLYLRGPEYLYCIGAE